MSVSKVKGVVDIVVLLDVSGSMQECIDAVKASVSTFIAQLSSKDANNNLPVKDWRMKVVGYRDHQADPGDWFVDNPFVRDVAALQSQLTAPAMQASGGGDEPESLLDALYKIAKMEQCGIQDAEEPNRWRARGAAARAVLFFTDATFKSPMTIAEASNGGVNEVHHEIAQSGLILCGFCPEWSGYQELGNAEGAFFRWIARAKDVPAIAGLGKPGDEGRAAMEAAVNALKTKASDAEAFSQVMVQLAKTVRKSAIAAPC